MQFTYVEYKKLLTELRKNGYEDIYYGEEKMGKSVILRHDVDYSLEKALDFAVLENELGFKSTYFILISSDFYNVFSKKSVDIIKQIINLNHQIGLHYDETKYIINNDQDLITTIQKEAIVLSEMLELEVNVMSMHRPSSKLLTKDLTINNLLNSYSKKYFEEMKYISDSRMNWRENPFEIINSGTFPKLHILTHPFWYANVIESINKKVSDFLIRAVEDRKVILEENITNLSEILKEE